MDNTVCLGFGAKGHAIETIKKVKDFVINVVDSRMLRAVEICGFSSGKNSNKLPLTDLTFTPSKLVHAPLVNETPISIECRTENVIEIDATPDLVFIIATVCGRLLDERLISEGRFQSAAFDPVLFIGDHHQRVYGYLEKGKLDPLGSFLPEKFLEETKR